MSTEYRISDPQVEERYRVVNSTLKELKDYCESKLQELSERSDLADIVEVCIDRFENGSVNSAFGDIDYDDDSEIIGVSTAKEFHWRSDNGFRDFISVEKKLSSNPQLVIKDEYDRVVSLSEFKAIIKK